MSSGPDFLREQAVVILDIVRRRWWLIAIPVAIACVLGVVVIKITPTKYTADSLIMLSGANRNMVGLNSSNAQRSSAVEQIGAIEAWLKSDQVLAPLLPRLHGYKRPASAAEQVIQLRLMRNALSLQLVGGSVLEVRLQGDKPQGLGRNLEIILSRLMEGLTGPEKNIFSAGQFVVMSRSDEVEAATAALNSAIDQSTTGDPVEIEKDLRQLWTLTHGSAGTTGARARLVLSQGPSDPKFIDDLRRKISDDPAAVARLEALYAARQTAQERLDSVRNQATGARSNYVGIFDAPDNLLIIGRPADPIFGESSGRKLAIAGLMLSILCGAGLAFVVEFLSGPLRTRSEFERISGLPVVARVHKLASDH